MKNFNPITPSLRHTVLLDHTLYNSENNLPLMKSLRQHGGRNHLGRITVRHRGHHHPREYRFLLGDTSLVYGVPLQASLFVYDACRSNFIVFLRSLNGVVLYSLSYSGISLHSTIVHYNTIPSSLKTGDRARLKYINPGSTVHNIAVSESGMGKLVRSAGSSAVLLKRHDSWSYVRLPSKRVIKVLSFCLATLGMCGNKAYRDQNIGKAGRNRWMGIRPSVRGVAMNPVDHPHGGGEGKKSKKATPRTPWGKYSHGQKLKKNKVLRNDHD